METEILRKLQPHNNNNWQATKESLLGGHLQETRGKWRLLLFLSFCTAIILSLGGESYQTSFQILKYILVKENGIFSLLSNAYPCCYPSVIRILAIFTPTSFDFFNCTMNHDAIHPCHNTDVNLSARNELKLSLCL